MDARAIRCSRESDTQLLIAVAAGNRGALEKLYLGYQRRLARFLWRFTRCRESIEEITNDTFMVVWRNASRFRFASAPSSWIFGIAYRTALKSMRQEGRHPATCDFGDRAQAVEPMLETEMQDWLAHGLERLSDEQRTALEFAYAGYPVAQIGEITGVPIGTVKARLFHGRHNLRRCLPILGGDVFELSAEIE
jgi:RNA polymerase sigma-70 factor, ECF subfamily